MHQTQCYGFPIRPLKWFPTQEGNHNGTTLKELEVAQYFRELEDRLGLDRGSGAVNLPAETAVAAGERAMRIDANHDNEGRFVVRGFDYQR